MIKSDKGGGPVHRVRQWWVHLSIVNKAIVLSCAFVIPILLVVDC